MIWWRWRGNEYPKESTNIRNSNVNTICLISSSYFFFIILFWCLINITRCKILEMLCGDKFFLPKQVRVGKPRDNFFFQQGRGCFKGQVCNFTNCEFIKLGPPILNPLQDLRMNVQHNDLLDNLCLIGRRTVRHRFVVVFFYGYFYDNLVT